VPFADFGPSVIPDWMDPDDAVLLTDVVPTGYQAAEMGGIQNGRHGGGVRAGPVGYGARAAPGCSARAGIVIDHVDYRWSSCAISPGESNISRDRRQGCSSRSRPTRWARRLHRRVGGDATGSALHTLFGVN
jgi:threonine dehydrogenase-like Zn-dependent dehydrogenase